MSEFMESSSDYMYVGYKKLLLLWVIAIDTQSANDQ